MIRKLTISRLHQYSSMFPDDQHVMVIRSILEGNTPGQLWISGLESRPSFVLLWDQGNNVLYITGHSPPELITSPLKDLLNHHIRCQAIQKRMTHVSVASLSPNIDKILPQLFLNRKPSNKTFYMYPESAGDPVCRPLAGRV